MPLNGNRLGTAIYNSVKDISIPQDSEISGETLESIWQTVANAIVNEFKNNALVNTTGQATGVQTGAGVAPTTSITGTIS